MKIPKAKKMSSGNYFIRLRLGGEEICITEPTEKECIRQAQFIKSEYLNQSHSYDTILKYSDLFRG